MSPFLVLCLIVVHCSQYGMSLDLLDPPQTIRGVVWEDWNSDGIRQSYEPPFAHVIVRLVANPTGDANFLVDASASTPIQPVYFFTLSDGKYSFDCLTPGNYSIEVEFPEDRPTTFSPANAGGDDNLDSDITFINGRIGSSDWFEASSADAKIIDVGAVQYIFMNLFPMTGREAVPPSLDTVLGSTYSIFDTRQNTLYYRIQRGPWEDHNIEVKAGFYQGYPGQNGAVLRTMGDRSSVKTNFWVVPANIVPLFKAGNVYVMLESNGTYSDHGLLRGNYNPFHNSKNVMASVMLSGENIVPTAVSTSATGTLNIRFSFDSDHFTYDLSLSNLKRSDYSKVEIRGPADANSNANSALIELTEGGGQLANISSISNFASNFFSGKLYVVVTSPDHPSGLIRGQISGFSQSVFSTSAFVTSYGAVGNALKIALALDRNKHTLSYYFTAEAPQDAFIELYFHFLTETRYVAFTYWKSGLWVAQGFFWNLSPEEEQHILESQGAFGSEFYIDVIAFGSTFFIFDSIFPVNWY